MKDASWKTLFEPKSKNEWIRKIKSDSKGTFSDNRLVQDLGEGVYMHAIQTKPDVKNLPHLDEASVYNTVPWQQDGNWKIAFPIQYKENLEDVLGDMHRAVAQGAEQLIFHSHQTKQHTFKKGQIEKLRALWLADEADIYTIQPFDQTQISLSSEENPQANILGDALRKLARLLEGSRNNQDALKNTLMGLQFIVPTGTNFYFEIARLRALRYIVARLVHEFMPHVEGYLINIPILAELYPSAEARIPDQLLTSTTRAMSAVLGGCTALVIYPHQNLSPEERQEALRLSINLQLILRHEAHLGHVSDAAAGAYYVEVLTHQLIQSAWEYYEQER